MPDYCRSKCWNAASPVPTVAQHRSTLAVNCLENYLRMESFSVEGSDGKVEKIYPWDSATPALIVASRMAFWIPDCLAVVACGSSGRSACSHSSGRCARSFPCPAHLASAALWWSSDSSWDCVECWKEEEAKSQVKPRRRDDDGARTCSAIPCWRRYDNMDNFWRCRSRCRTASVACLARPLSIAQSIERSCTVASPSLTRCRMLTVPWIPKNEQKLKKVHAHHQISSPCRWSCDCCVRCSVVNRSRDSCCDAGWWDMSWPPTWCRWAMGTGSWCSSALPPAPGWKS